MDYRITTTSPPMGEPISLTEAKLHLRVDGSTDDTLITSLIKAAREYCEAFQGRTYMATTFQMKMDDWPNDTMKMPNAPLWSVDSITYVDSGGTTQTCASTVYSIDKVAEPGILYVEYQQVWPSHRGTYNDITINFNAGYSASFTAADTDVCTCSSRTFANADKVRIYNSGGALPAGLSTDTDYYVRDISGSTFKLYTAATGGTAVNITDAGTGTHYIGCVPASIVAAMKLLIGHLYEHREMVSDIALNEVPFTVKHLLWMERLTGF